MADERKSMFFPARVATAEDHLAWWSDVPVPDRVLADVMEQFPKAHSAEVEVQMAPYGGTTFQPREENPYAESRNQYEEYLRQASAQHQAALESVQGLVPTKQTLDRTTLREVVRVYLANRYAYSLPEAERERFRATMLQAGLMQGTPPQIAAAHRMNGIATISRVFDELPEDRDHDEIVKETQRLDRKLASIMESTLYSSDVDAIRFGVPLDMEERKRWAARQQQAQNGSTKSR